ncbi:hypothetical protein [Iodobacter sp. LRB]
MVFDAHDRAFAFFGGVPLRMVYDNLKSVVEPVQASGGGELLTSMIARHIFLHLGWIFL